MLELVPSDRISYLDVLRARTQDLPPPTLWDDWGECYPRSHVLCICGRREIRAGEALCPICDGPE